jgi:hypothetical protein
VRGLGGARLGRGGGDASGAARWTALLSRARRGPVSRVSDTVVQVGPCVVGWAVRLGAAVLAAALIATAWFGYGRWPAATGALVTAAAFVLVAVWPSLAVGALLLVGTGVFGAGVPPLWLLLTLVLLGHLAVAVAGLAVRVRLLTRVEWAVVGLLARDFVVVQAGAQLLALVAALIGGMHVAAGDAVRAAAVVLVVVALAVVLPWAPTRKPR